MNAYFPSFDIICQQLSNFYPKLFTQFNFYPARFACPVECEAYSSGVTPEDGTGVKSTFISPGSKNHLTGALSRNG